MDYEELHKKPPYAMIAILFIGAFVAFLNNTLLNIALPTIMEEFDVKPSTVQWVTTAYMLVNGILIPASAFFVTKFTNRRLFIVAMSLFSFGTFLAFITPTFSLLIVARMIQASGSALMMPLLMNIMLAAFPIEKRGTAMGVFGLVMFTAPAIGPTLSGWVIEHYTWRTLFAIVLPFSLATLAYAIFRLRNITENRDMSLDLTSLLLSSVGFGGLLYGFSTAGEKGWGSPIVYGTILIGAISLLVFILRQLKMDDPMLDFKIYKYPMFALASVISIVISVSMFSAMLLTPLYVQSVRGISPFEAGILMLPGAIVMGLMSPITGRLFDKYGAKILAVTGLTITIAMTYLLSTLTMESGYYYIMIIYTVRMFGMSMVMMPIMTNGLNQLPMHSNPHGTALNNTLQQVSGAIGSAVLLTIMTKKSENTGVQLFLDAQADGLIPTDPTAIEQFKQQVELQAMLEGINYTFFLSTVFAAIALLLTFFIKRVEPPMSDKSVENIKSQQS